MVEKEDIDFYERLQQKRHDEVKQLFAGFFGEVTRLLQSYPDPKIIAKAVENSNLVMENIANELGKLKPQEFPEIEIEFDEKNIVRALDKLSGQINELNKTNSKILDELSKKREWEFIARYNDFSGNLEKVNAKQK